MNFREFTPLYRFFETSPDVPTSGEVRTLLKKTLIYREALARETIQITFVGMFNGGKSSLINRLIGQPILPTGLDHSTGVVTRIMRGETIQALVVYGRGDRRRVERVEVEDLGPYIMFDHAEFPPPEPAGVTEVNIHIPFPILPSDCVLVDTPGFMNSAALGRKTRLEIERSDLVIMVLIADQLASQDERAIWASIHALLGGNIALVINRKDRLSNDQQQKVMNWVKESFDTRGNPIIGAMPIFLLSATNDSTADINAELGTWMRSMLADDTRASLALYARLSNLDYRLTQLINWIEMHKAEQQQQLDMHRNQRLSEQSQVSSDFNKLVRNLRLALPAIRVDLPFYYAQFTQRWIQETSLLKGTKLQRSLRFQRGFFIALNSYIDMLSKRVDVIFAGHGFAIPRFVPEAMRYIDKIDQFPSGGGRTDNPHAGKNLAPFMPLRGKYSPHMVKRLAAEYEPQLIDESNAYLDRIDQLLSIEAMGQDTQCLIASGTGVFQREKQAQNQLLSWAQDFRKVVRQITSHTIGGTER